MPSYAFRCKNCGTRFDLFYKTIKDYEDATPLCVQCGSESLSRLIQQVAISRPGRDYSRMSSNEMLSVFESGDSRQVGEMFQQVGGGGGLSPETALPYHDATERLLRGEKMDKVERDLRANERPDTSTSD
jgi:putative FmdB family regulatory protein